MVYPKSVIIVFPEFKISVFHFINMFNIYSGESPVDIDNYSNCNGSFRCCNSNDKQTKKESFEPVRIEVTVKCKKIDVHGIQNQFNRHENTNQVPAGKKTIYAHEEHDGSEDEEILDGDA
jgi:hypothetical protein